MILTNFYDALEPSVFQIVGFEPLLDDEVNFMSHLHESTDCTAPSSSKARVTLSGSSEARVTLSGSSEARVTLSGSSEARATLSGSSRLYECFATSDSGRVTVGDVCSPYGILTSYHTFRKENTL